MLSVVVPPFSLDGKAFDSSFLVVVVVVVVVAVVNASFPQVPSCCFPRLTFVVVVVVVVIGMGVWAVPPSSVHKKYLSPFHLSVETILVSSYGAPISSGRCRLGPPSVRERERTSELERLQKDCQKSLFLVLSIHPSWFYYIILYCTVK